MSSSSLDITRLLEAVSLGDRDAANKLFGVVYDELKRMAGSKMRMEKSQTLQSTALVHEVWLKLIGDREEHAWKSRGHFFATAALAMRRILVDAARARKRLKRGGDAVRFEIREDDLITRQDDDLIALDEALEMLREVDEKKADLVCLRYFGGLTNAQAAEQLDISPATAERYWAFAKAWLRSRIESED